MLQIAMKDAAPATMSLVSMQRVGEAVLPRRSVQDGHSLQPGDPALHAVTDFTREYPVTVDAERQIDDALNDMIRLGVRALLVATDQRLVGLITSYDIQGEKPMQFLQSSNYNRHQDIRVADIMTPWDQLLAVDWASIQSASAGDLLRVFEESGLSHLLVIEVDQKRTTATVRALASRARLMRQLEGLRLAG
ncbi:MAG TPA: CBS domain-containing protein [Steroidobacteraceae bacterium]|nr:CBS domain-containing protein [Steroidobacteraceae bacterium]